MDHGEYAARWRGITDTTVTAAGSAMYALTAGDPDADTVHLLVHGLGGSALSWLELIPRLAVDAHVVAVDLPGFGRSPLGERSPTVASYTDVVHALVRDHAARDVVLHGNSLGGLLAARVAHRTPHRVRALVLASPAVPMAVRRAWPLPVASVLGIGMMGVPGVGEGLLWAAARRGEPFADDRMVEAVFAHPERLRTPEVTAAYAAEQELFRSDPARRRALVGATRSVLAATVAGGVGWSQLVDDEVPTLVLWGEHDRLLPPGMLTEIRRRRRAWDVRMLLDAGHAPQFDAPDRYDELVRGFLGDQRLRRAG